MRTCMCTCAMAVLVLAVAMQTFAETGEHDHDGPTHEPADLDPADPHRHHAHPGVDLGHPIVGESPVPETHVIVRYSLADLGGGDGREHTAAAEIEYAFVREFSVEAALPYTFLDADAGAGGGESADHFNDAEVSFKLATYEWVDRNVLPAVGLSVVLPTGNEEEAIGSDHVLELEPFARVGVWRGPFEFIGGVALGIPLHRKGEEREEEDFAVSYNLSTLYHVAPSVQALIEVHGESVFGDADDEHALYVSPGLMTQPFRDKSITVGAGISLPLTDDREFDFAVNLVAIVHF